MSYGGHVIDMINRMKQNKALLASRRARMRDIRNMYVSSIRYNISTADKPVSPEVLAGIKAEIREKVRLRRKREKIVLALLFIPAALICIFIFWVLFLR